MISETIVRDYILPLADPLATLAVVGGKGASLARLSGSGIPVPGGFHVCTQAYQEFVAANHLPPRILALLKKLNAAEPAALEQASRSIGQWFAEAHIPVEIAAGIARAYATLPGVSPAVAVRSSATAEDLPEASFAGQQETYLNVSGGQSVLEAVRKCWASLWSGRAIAYRARQGIGSEGLSLAVVVQLLVPAQAAGILFTANPVNGRRDQVVISASWGLGEAVVGGLVNPDSLTVDKASGHILERLTADKSTMTVCTENGTQEQPVADALRHAPVLHDEAVIELTALAVQVERIYGMAMDIEWAWVDGVFAILQARPITALPEPEMAPPVGWPLPDPRATYMRGSISDFLPDPLTPLFASMGLPALQANLNRVLDHLLGSHGLLPEKFFLTINDYSYMNYRFKARQWWQIVTRMVPKLFKMLREGERHWRESVLPRYAEASAYWKTVELEKESAPELLQGVQRIVNLAAEYLTSLQVSTMGAAAGSEGLFTVLYNKLMRRADDPAAPTFLMGFDNIPIQAEKELYDLAQWCRERERLAFYLVSRPSRQIADRFRNGVCPLHVPADDWGAWRERLQGYLETYGHSIYDLDFGKLLPAEDTTPTMAALQLFIRGLGKNPHVRQQDLARQREVAVQGMLNRLKWLKLKIFRKSLSVAQRLAPVREDGIANIGLGYPVLRRMLRELGRRLVQRGMLEGSDDIFWMQAVEIERAADALEKKLPVDNLQQTIQQRRALWRAEKRLTPPSQLPMKGKMFGIKTEAWVPVSADTQTGNILKGLGASPGQVTATARVLHGPGDFGQMQPGEILVADTTTPAWTPLFAMASAIVTNVGGPLSHGSIVAREYGIPAVLGTGVSTKRIRSGQTIRVDGSAGVVTLL